MYADRVEAGGKRSIRERLNGNVGDDSARRRQLTGKRQRQDDKWEHDLYEDDDRQGEGQNFGARDLRLKLQRKNLQQSGRGSLSGVRDLREKLSGTMNSLPVKNSRPIHTDPPRQKPGLETAKPVRRSVADEAPMPETKRVTNSAARKKTQHKADSSVDGFLQSLGLEKYLITFQAEEVDMTALMHMTDDDLKAIGIPMGPRKKILLELESKV